MHALETIAKNAPAMSDQANVQNTKHEALDRAKHIATRDDKIVGLTLAAEVVAAAHNSRNQWRVFAMKIVNLTHEARESFLNALKAEKKGMTAQQTEFGIAAKMAQKRTNSFATQISELRTIANAWNNGASITGWREYVNTTVPEDKRVDTDEDMAIYGGYVTMIEYARVVVGKKSKAGRPAKSYMEKVMKFLEDTKPEEDDAKGRALYEQLLALYNSKV